MPMMVPSSIYSVEPPWYGPVRTVEWEGGAARLPPIAISLRPGG